MARSLRRLCTAHPRHLVVDDDTVKLLACADELERLGAVLDLLVSDTEQIERLQRQRKADERIIFDVKRTVVVGKALLDDWRFGARIFKTRIDDAVDLTGYAHLEARALAVALGAQHERAVVLAQELADYWQPETCATIALHLPSAHLSEHQVLAERAELALAEPDPLVLDRHGQLRPARPHLDDSTAVRSRTDLPRSVKLIALDIPFCMHCWSRSLSAISTALAASPSGAGASS
mmetsp:Transcript_46381/g.107052  ORF Transcript_46381/g.107052 Transcript_46381/m.107052 type:complete len:235 (+) Transcript_46381:770-1474(+)